MGSPVIMPPHPIVELDLDRKEELILAKQLRACRVNILPKPYETNRLNSRSPSSPRTPDSGSSGDGGRERDFVAELTAMTLKSRNNAGECRPDPRSPATPGPQSHKAKEVASVVLDSPKIMVTPPPPAAVLEGNKSISRFFTSDEDIPSTPATNLPPMLPFLGDIKKLKKASPVPVRSNTLPKSDSEEPKLGSDLHLGHIENRPKLGNLPFLAEIRNLRPELKDDALDSSSPRQNMKDEHGDNRNQGQIKFNDHSNTNSHKSYLTQTDKSYSPQLGQINSPELEKSYNSLLEKSYIPPPPPPPLPPPYSSKTENSCVQQPQKSYQQELNKSYYTHTNKYDFPERENSNYPHEVKSCGRQPDTSNITSQQQSHSSIQSQSIKSNEPLSAHNNFAKEIIDSSKNNNNNDIYSNSTNDTINRQNKPNSSENVSQHNTNISNTQHGINSSDQITHKEDPHFGNYSPKPNRSKKTPRNVIKIDEKTNMGKLADQIIPQLNHMQKNFLGLLFFNELSNNIVEDMVAQQLSMMSSSKLAMVIQNLDKEACDAVVPLLMETVSLETRANLACQAMAPLDTEEKAGVVFTTSDNVMEVCTTMAEYGGRGFKKALIRNLVASEDESFMDEIVYNHLKKNTVLTVPREQKKSTASSNEDDFTSCEGSLAEEGGKDDAEEVYEYLDFE